MHTAEGTLSEILIKAILKAETVLTRKASISTALKPFRILEHKFVRDKLIRLRIGVARGCTGCTCTPRARTYFLA